MKTEGETSPWDKSRNEYFKCVGPREMLMAAGNPITPSSKAAGGIAVPACGE